MAEPNRNLQPLQFYHGTHAKLSPGALVQPGHPPNYESSSPEHVYFSPQAESARWYAYVASNMGTRGEHTYQVEPTGAHEMDPESIGSFVPPSLKGSRRSISPLRVIGEV